MKLLTLQQVIFKVVLAVFTSEACASLFIKRKLKLPEMISVLSSDQVRSLLNVRLKQTNIKAKKKEGLFFFFVVITGSILIEKEVVLAVFMREHTLHSY